MLKWHALLLAASLRKFVYDQQTSNESSRAFLCLLRIATNHFQMDNLSKYPNTVILFLRNIFGILVLLCCPTTTKLELNKRTQNRIDQCRRLTELKSLLNIFSDTKR